MQRWVLLAVLLWAATPSVARADPRVRLTFDTSEADQVLAILALRTAGKPILAEHWEKLFATEPYRRLKVREQKIADQFKAPENVLTDEAFKKFVLSDALLQRAPALRATLARWKKEDLEAAAQHPLQYLPSSAVIRAKVFPMIKPNSNSFVWETSTDPTIFLYLDPDVSPAKFANTVAHELHHIGLTSAQAEYDRHIKTLPARAATTAEWIAAFGEGQAMLAAAGGPDVDPHAASSPQERARWEHDLANFDRDLRAVDAFFLDILHGKFAGADAISAKGSSFFGAQGPWYTVGYRMAVIVEKQFGRGALITTMLDPRRLLLLYNQAVAARHLNLPMWSKEILEQVKPSGSHHEPRNGHHERRRAGFPAF